MTVVDPITLDAPLLQSGQPSSAPTPVSADFADYFTQQLGEVNGQLMHAEHGLQLLATGQASNLHQVMINLEEAKLSLQLVAQVRNRLLDAFQEILRMQV